MEIINAGPAVIVIYKKYIYKDSRLYNANKEYSYYLEKGLNKYRPLVQNEETISPVQALTILKTIRNDGFNCLQEVYRSLQKELHEDPDVIKEILNFENNTIHLSRLSYNSKKWDHSVYEKLVKKTHCGRLSELKFYKSKYFTNELCCEMIKKNITLPFLVDPDEHTFKLIKEASNASNFKFLINISELEMINMIHYYSSIYKLAPWTTLKVELFLLEKFKAQFISRSAWVLEDTITEAKDSYTYEIVQKYKIIELKQYNTSEELYSIIISKMRQELSTNPSYYNTKRIFYKDKIRITNSTQRAIFNSLCQCS